MQCCVWEYEQPRKRVWAQVHDVEQWPISIEVFDLVVGHKFRTGPLPVLGTHYVGRLFCQVNEVIEYELVTLRLYAPKFNGDVATSWDLCWKLSDAASGGTLWTTELHGVHDEDPQERILLAVLKIALQWIHGHAHHSLGCS
ncbi:Uncharacterised protein [Mycobacteroides abscessus subsp. massiliense]|nr:Uncharacterised protein [Mycobacteroides abscessus subsp. massiliense]SKM20291.1 Uncharacterised protein [Mycobacteroides abscessus subsp. massiliense]